jgi:hypothetical protein
MKRHLAALAVLAIATSVHAQRQEPRFFRDGWNEKAYAAAPRLAETTGLAPAVVLPAAETAMPEKLDEIAQWNAEGREPMKIGFARALPDAIQVGLTTSVAAKPGPVAFSRGVIANTERGTVAWGTTIQVDRASRLRLHLENVKLPEGATLWVYGAGETPRGFGAELVENGSLWSPSVEGPTIYLDVEAPAGAQTSFSIRELMQIVNATVHVPAPDDVPSCLMDASCVGSSQFDQIANVSRGIAQLQFVKNGGTFVCSGGLLNDRGTTGTPYLLTANHCMSDQSVVSTLEAFFDYKTSSCNGAAPSFSSLPRASGAQLLASSSSSDFTFVQLNSRPSGRYFLGWDARTSVIQHGVKLHRLSHPVPSDHQLRTQQYSMTNVNAALTPCTGPSGGAANRPSFVYSSTVFGGTYGGSSGSPIILDGGYVVGQLLGGCPSGGADPNDGCDTRNSDVDGALSSTYSSVAAWLDGTPVTPSVCTASATTLCLSSNRFAVSVSWKSNEGQGTGQAVPMTSDTGYFWFFSATNVEMVVKLLNACVPALGNKFWVFAGGLTNVQVTMTVIDTKTGSVKTYVNPQNTAFQPIQDVAAFSTCP